MIVENLEFFDKNGYNLNLNWNEEKHIWEGNIFFPRVSVGLYENTTIYVIEYCGSDSNLTDVCTYPTGSGNITFQWDAANTFVDEFFMFNFDENYEIKDTSSLIHTPYDGPLCETLIINRFDKFVSPLFNPSLGTSQNIEQDDLLEIHVAFKADEKSAETTYKRTLVMSYENGYIKYEIARITFFAETIEEDERLKIWNENLGYKLKPEDTLIFKNSDIHEYMPDFEMLNEKRKELMLEGHNIYPYIGSYKGIINMIKFFGYDNLNIVEYWRNINADDSEFGKIYRTYIYSIKDKKTLSTKRKPITLNTKKFQKLNNISLVYNINHPERDNNDNIYDEYGLPNVIEDFDKNKRDDFILTIEEALVKMFALKKKLNDDFMPGSTIITDIIGEGNYFSLNLIGNNPQISTVNYVESKGYVDFTVFPNKYCYITENEDLYRYIGEKLEKNVEKTIIDNSNITISELEEKYANDSDYKNSIDIETLSQIVCDLFENNNDIACEYYEEYYNITYDNNYGDAKNYGLREIPEPKNVHKDVNGVSSNMTICAKVILKGTFNKNIDATSIIEWKITHPEKEWSVSYTGEVKTYENVFVQLPYLGNYDVEMCVWDRYNHCCKQFTKDAIIVEPYNIDIKGFYYDARPLPNALKYDLMIPYEYRNDDSGVEKYRYYLWYSIDDSGVKKGIVTRKSNPLEMTLSDIIGEYLIDGIDIKYYIGLENLTDVEKENWISIVNTENDTINKLKISWVYIGDNDYNFGVDTFDFDGELTDVPFDENDSYAPEWNEDELYNVIKKNFDKMYSGALQEHLNDTDENMIMRNYQKDGSVSVKGPYYKFDVDTILYRIERNYKEYDHLNEEIINLNPGEHYKYVRYINSVVDIKPLTWTLLGFDYTKITGRIVNEEYPKWTLTKIGDSLDDELEFREDKVIATHCGLYFTYLYEYEGVYKIKLEIADINGNKYKIEKPIVIVDKDANYEMYHTLKNEYDKYLEAKYERNLIYVN